MGPRRRDASVVGYRHRGGRCHRTDGLRLIAVVGLEHDGETVWRLSPQGRRLVEMLALADEHDEEAGDDGEDSDDEDR